MRLIRTISALLVALTLAACIHAAYTNVATHANHNSELQRAIAQE